jgi:hypothetical protein
MSVGLRQSQGRNYLLELEAIGSFSVKKNWKGVGQL